MLTECENCSSHWGPGSEEYDFQQCDACGWQPGVPLHDDIPGSDYDNEEDFENGSLDY